MTPLPPNNTSRYKVFYTNDSHQHTTTVRVGSISPGTFGAEFDLLFQALSPLLPATTIDEVQFAPSGSNIFNTVSSGIEGNTYGSGGAPVGAAEFVSFVGRSAGGHKVRLFVYGINAIAASDYRFVAGEDASIDAAAILLNASTPTYFSIDGVKPVWKSYANAGVSAYWQKALRP